MNRTQIYKSLLPDDFTNEIKSEGDALSKACWRFGYHAKFAVAELEKYKGEMVRGEQHFIDAVMCFTAGDLLYCIARDAGVSFHTLRNYYYVAAFYDPETVDHYGEILPFSYFEYAKSQGEDAALEILKFAVDEYHRRGGQNCGLDWLKMQFIGAAGDPGVLDDNYAVGKFDDLANQYITEDDLVVISNAANNPTDQPLLAPVWYLVNAAGSLFTRLEQNVLRLQMDQETRGKFLVWLETIREMTDELKQEFSENV